MRTLSLDSGAPCTRTFSGTKLEFMNRWPRALDYKGVSEKVQFEKFVVPIEIVTMVMCLTIEYSLTLYLPTRRFKAGANWAQDIDLGRRTRLVLNWASFGFAIHQNDHEARRRFVEWAQNEIAVVPDFHKRILFSDEAHFWLNGYVNKQNCRIWSEANPQVYVETPLHPEKLTVRCALWAVGIIGSVLLQKR
ncbi:hypothetical protein TNCV_3355181 [Trichonephila clavipes]|nr:hypothetical protein TNCV_3355181 [Trichonephila clavipes]